MSDSNDLLSGLSVLLVEDQPLIALMVEEFVHELGSANCLTAFDQNGAVAVIDRCSFDLAILDVNLTDAGPDFHIADLLHDRGIPFVFTSGHTVADLPARHRHVPFLSKPFELSNLADGLRAIIVDKPEPHV